jgi:plastocyanin
MRKLFLALAIVIPGGLFVPLAASAANSPAQIVNCARTPSWCFSPNPIQIAVGSTVTWTNTTAPTHTSTSNTGVWNTGPIAPGATSAAVSFPTAGTFAYHCTFHPTMTGSVIVSPAATGLAPGGGGPQLLVGSALLLFGLGLLAARGVRRYRSHHLSS